MSTLKELLSRPVTAPLWVYVATAIAAFVIGVIAS